MASNGSEGRPVPSGSVWTHGKRRRREAAAFARRRRGSECRWSRVLVPWVEGLEDRTVLSTVTWVGTNGGDWDAAANWSPAGVPTSGDDVVIKPSSAQTITHTQNQADSVLSLTTNSYATLDLTAGSLTVGNGTSTFGGPITVGSAATMAMAAGASVTIPVGETLTDDGTLSFAAGDTVSLPGNCCGTYGQLVVAGTLNVAGTTFNGGGPSITVDSGGTINPTGSTFNVVLVVPYNEVAALTNNVSFDQIEIESGTLSSGTLALNAIGTTTTHLSYAFPAGFKVGSDGTLTVAAGLPVTIPVGETVTDDGTMSFGSGDTVSLPGNCCGTYGQLVVAGTLNAAGTTFNGGGPSVTVDNGGVIDPTGSAFNVGLFVPYNDVPALTNNVSFDQIYIESGTLSSGTLALNAIGTTTTNLSYSFPSGFTVGPAGTLTVAAGLPVTIPIGETVTDDGTMSFGSGDTVSLPASCCGSYGQLVVAGILNATSTTFNGGTPSVIVNNGGVIDPTGSAFNVGLFVPYNDVPALTNNVSFDQIYIDSGILSSGTLALNAIGTVTTNLSYSFPSGFTVASGGTLTVAAGLPVTIPVGETVTDDGTVSFGSGDTVSLPASCCGSYGQLIVAGTLNATSTTFDGGTPSITVNSGGVIDPTDSTFNVGLYVPYNDVPALSNNLSFDQIYIESGTLSSGTLALNSIGTNTTNLSYIFSGGFTVGSGSTLAVGPGVPVTISYGETLTDNGMVTFASDDTVTLAANCCGSTGEVVVAGILNAAGTTFTGSSSNITVNSGGSITAVTSTFGMKQLVLNAGSSATLHFDTFTGQLALNSGMTSINIAGNNLSGVGANGVIATGTATAHIPLEENYWATTDPTAIGALILDHNDDATRPYIDFQSATEPVWSNNSGTIASPVTVIYSPSSQNIPLTAAVETTGGIPITGGQETFTILNSSGQQVGQTTVPENVVSGSVSATYSLPGGTSIGQYTIEAEYSGDTTFPASTDTSQLLTVTPLAGQVAITSPALNMVAGTMEPVTVQLEDSNGNPGATSTSDQTISLGTTSTAGVFYVNQAGDTPITSVVIPAGESSATVYSADTLAAARRSPPPTPP